MKQSNTRSIVAILSAAFLLLAALTWGIGDQDAQAAPAALVTPVSVSVGQAPAEVITLFNAQRLTADGNSTELQVGAHQKIDLQAVVDVTAVNTTTLKLQFSNNGDNWVDGQTFGTALVADTNTLQQYFVYGRYVRVNADVTNSQPITFTVIGVLR